MRGKQIGTIWGEEYRKKGEVFCDEKSNTHKTEADELGARKENAQWRVEDTGACSAQQLGQGVI